TGQTSRPTIDGGRHFVNFCPETVRLAVDSGRRYTPLPARERSAGAGGPYSGGVRLRRKEPAAGARTGFTEGKRMREQKKGCGPAVKRWRRPLMFALAWLGVAGACYCWGRYGHLPRVVAEPTPGRAVVQEAAS